jgi:hypothetical protein
MADLKTKLDGLDKKNEKSRAIPVTGREGP